MTSISSTSMFQGQSPSDRIQAQLQAAIANGTIKSADQTALSSALGDVGTALRAGGAGAASSTPGSSTSIKDKVSSLIDTEVSNGKLTADQATEMKGLFEQAAPAVGGTHGHHGGHHHHAAPAADSTDAATTATDGTTATTSSTTTAAATSPADALDKIVDFLQTVQASRTQSGYGATGDATTGTSPALLVDQSI